ncbi:MAG: ATP-binding protein [Eubacterium sp.]|nr:ATP-binding protein [Eubacterium sp.]
MITNEYEITIEARKDKLDDLMIFIDSHLEEFDCSMKAQMQIDVAVEELFVNIANYAYAPEIGNATIRMIFSDEPGEVTIVFIDSGVPYDPLKKDDPDITLSVDERAIGGLGIFMVKKSMDDMFYEYKDGQNILSIVKKLG